MMDKLYIIKIGGNIIDNPEKLAQFLEAFAAIDALKILVHGGGKLATQLADTLGIAQTMVDGRRITDAETLKIVTMVYAGQINKTIVAELQKNNCNAIGLSGADGNLIQAHQRISKDGISNWGHVGDIDQVNTSLIDLLLKQLFTIVIAPISHDKNGQLLNTNADTIAKELAKAMSALYETQLIYSFEKAGVLLNAEDDSTVIKTLTPAYYQTLKTEQIIFSGMIPKLDNAFAALNNGVKRVVIGMAEHLNELIEGTAGTSIILNQEMA